MAWLCRILVALLLLVSAAHAADPVVAQRNAAIIAKNHMADGIFSVDANGEIHHRQSGMTCPAAFSSAVFWDAQIFDSPRGLGTDVGCDYGRNGLDGRAALKLTIFATQAPAGTTLDAAFAGYQQELRSFTPDVRYLGQVTGLAASAVPFRSADYAGTLPAPFRTQLIVAVENGWVLEVRITVRDADATPDDFRSAATAFAAAVQSLSGATGP